MLSSRPEEYRQAISDERLHNTAVIEVQPVEPEVARAYLLHDQIGSQHDRWAQVGDYLTGHPDSITAYTLNNPLTLSLARAAYQDQDPTSLTDPAEFTTVAALREHLIDRTLITAYPDEHQRAHATRWLAWIAHHLDSDRDLAWWHIPTWIPRRQLRLVVGLAGGLAGEVGKEPQAIFPRWPRPRELPRLLVGGLAFGLAVGLVGLLDLWIVPLPRAATATPAARYRIDRRTSIAAGLVLGLAVGLMFGSMPTVSLTELVLATTGAGRVKFIRVLEDAHHRQVLRQTGAVYQFRHAELQDHLADIHRRHTRPHKYLSTDTTNPT